VAVLHWNARCSLQTGIASPAFVTVLVVSVVIYCLCLVELGLSTARLEVLTAVPQTIERVLGREAVFAGSVVPEFSKNRSAFIFRVKLSRSLLGLPLQLS
jgi:hypothetical protein